MRISERWLRDWCDFPGSFRQWAERMTAAGLEVSGPDPVNPGLSGVVTARIVSTTRHPEADRLQICQVDCGAGDLEQIVCGAPNARPGLVAPLARPGAVLPGGRAIQAASLRGVASAGMLCGADELGLGEAGGGLLELPEDTPPGQDLVSLLGLDDALCELDLTPNRADCLSVRGVARETRAVYGLPAAAGGGHPTGATRVALTSEAAVGLDVHVPEAAPRFCLRVLRGIDPAARSPLWLCERLRRAGLRAIHPVVDATQHVMLEYGQPTHAYDLARLTGPVSVRWSRRGERLLLLDGQTPVLDDDTLLIADEAGPLALAGIMGGKDSSVTSSSNDILLEAAFFSPTAIAGRARRYGLHTDASHRFERGVDPVAVIEALEALTTLVLSICGGSAGPVVEAVSPAHLPARPTVRVREERIARVLGTRLTHAAVLRHLEATGSRVLAAGEGVFGVEPPSHRFDLTIEADYIEEVARLEGYDRLRELPPTAMLAMLPAPETRRRLPALQQQLVQRGYQEAINFSFTDSKLQKLVHPESEVVAVRNPIAQDLDVLRTSLWPGLLGNLQTNLNRQQRRLRLFELGHVFSPEQGAEGGYREHAELGLLVAGLNEPEQWGLPAREADFFDLKADLEALVGRAFEAPDCPLLLERASHPALHPGQSARLLSAGRVVGWLGRLHPRLEAELDLPLSALLAAVELAALVPRPLPRFEPLSRFPASRRDLALVVDTAVPARSLVGIARAAGGEHLREVGLFDLYTGEGIESGRKSIALSLIFQASSSTLADEDIDAAVARVVVELSARAGASLRA
jgi:phenylalanyl-tRNA synthetase beta chain